MKVLNWILTEGNKMKRDSGLPTWPPTATQSNIPVLDTSNLPVFLPLPSSMRTELPQDMVLVGK